MEDQNDEQFERFEFIDALYGPDEKEKADEDQRRFRRYLDIIWRIHQRDEQNRDGDNDI